MRGARRLPADSVAGRRRLVQPLARIMGAGSLMRDDLEGTV